MEVGHVTALDTLIKGLNSKQREAVLTTEGPVLIAAGAGSGKTRVLTHRIAYLIQERQVNPWNILAITFTNKAATEMRERVQRLVGEEASSIWVATFHAMCARILRREIETLGYAKNFTIIDQGEQQTLMKQVLRDLNLDSDQYNYKDLLWVIDAAKNQGYLPDDFLASDSGYIHEIHANIYRNYQKRLKAANALDFNDLILLTVRLLEQNPTIRQFYQQKFQYIHVDEYQDTNHSQYRLVQLLAGLLKNICVVGDADQSIYGWRGANMANILNFEQDYPQAKVILLEQNYRSTQTILKAANSVIENNLQRKDKQLWSDGQVGEKIQIYSADSDLEEADFVTLHVPAQKEFVIGQKEFDLMKNGAALVNCARGGVVDEEALLKALDSGKLAFAGLDVFINEPTPAKSILSHPKISLTPHTGASTNEAQDRIGISLAEQIISILK